MVHLFFLLLHELLVQYITQSLSMKVPQFGTRESRPQMKILGCESPGPYRTWRFSVMQ